MRLVDFPPLNRQVPFLGLGCGRLDGRIGFRRSAKMIETALDLGIRYFDVAPSYGHGTAEEVLGAVAGNCPEVVIATKHGIPRPPYPSSSRRHRLKHALKPALDWAKPIKRRIAKNDGVPPLPVDQHDFSETAILESLEESLRLLKRSKVDVFLAHEPTFNDFNKKVVARFEKVVALGLASCFGAGVGAMLPSPPAPFGSVWQSCWPIEPKSDVAPPMNLYHGALRFFGGKYAPVDSSTIAQRLVYVTQNAPHSVLLISASTPQRLKSIVTKSLLRLDADNDIRN